MDFQVVGSSLITAIGGTLVALIAIVTKKTPEKKDSMTVMQESINLLSHRVETLEKSNDSLWQDVERLRGQVSSFRIALDAAKAYIRHLESKLFDAIGVHEERPEDIERMMRE